MDEHELAMVQIDRSDRAVRYYRVAWEYLETYQAVALQHPADFGELTSPKLFLLCHALEVAMKGWLVLREGTPEKVTPSVRNLLRSWGIQLPATFRTLKDYSHNLAALGAVAGQYYPALHANMPTLRRLTESYWGSDEPELRGTRGYEYPEGNPVLQHVPLSELARLVDSCVQDLLAAANEVRCAAASIMESAKEASVQDQDASE